MDSKFAPIEFWCWSTVTLWPIQLNQRTAPAAGWWPLGGSVNPNVRYWPKADILVGDSTNKNLSINGQAVSHPPAFAAQALLQRSGGLAAALTPCHPPLDRQR